jgi:RHH-type proline utilization regulon transcriptional repressor/proline dehydrogenase/delta 1-pyrroline-5-carboxylate dehydrogenase
VARPIAPPFDAPYFADDATLLRGFAAETELDAETDARIDVRASRYIEAAREKSGFIGGVEDLLREYGLSTDEGIALMTLAEALLRVPDAATQDLLIRDRITAADWEDHVGRGGRWLSPSARALALSARLLESSTSSPGVLTRLIERVGMPVLRTATRQAMRLFGRHFVLGETIEEALRRGRRWQEGGYSLSYDMLGEGARTARDAQRYFEAYRAAIAAIGAEAGASPSRDRPGISVKLSALHPRYEPLQRERVLEDLTPRLVELARAARAHDLELTVDAEEADRLELSLEVIARASADGGLAGWEGFGLAVQAYQKRAVAVIEWARDLAAAHHRRLIIRLVKGAYWDTEIKRGQERGLPDYPVFTRKPATDLSYLACAVRLLAARPRLFPQFATHNALTIATIGESAGDRSGYEFQRLHGMGEAIYRAVKAEHPDSKVRIYAPVGGHRDLLGYLVRRLLENSAGSSFLMLAGDRDVPITELLMRPARILDGGAKARHPAIPLPRELYAPERVNSAGIELGERRGREALLGAIAAAGPPEAATPLGGGGGNSGTRRAIVSPADRRRIVGHVVELGAEAVPDLVQAASAGFVPWSATSAAERSETLLRAADLIEADRAAFVSLLADEAGKTLVDALAEVREAVDFCRFYAAEARRLLASSTELPGPVGEANGLSYRPRGAFVCISPWNFPLSIFVGQVTAALAAGNSVIAKPAEQTPLIAHRAVRLLHRAGVPNQALCLAPGDGALGAAIVAHPDIAGVAFTGSTETAWAINRTLANKNGPIVPLIAETGGINAMVVDATALPEQASDDIVLSAFRSAGQRCSALRVLYVQDDIADELLTMIEGATAELRIGDPRDPSTDIGPVIDEAAKAALEEHLATVREAGDARVRFAATLPEETRVGNFVAPHIVEIDDPSFVEQEVFGPVLHVFRWRQDGLGQVLEAIAGTGQGLTLGIHSRVESTVQAIVERLRVGNVYVNRSMIGAVVGTQPFGGSGLSGTGPKAGGPDYLRRFLLEQVVSTNTAAIGGNAALVAIGDSE